MPAQQDPKQIRRPLDEFRRDLKHVAKDELLRSVLSELTRGMLRLCLEQGVKISPIERRDDGIAEIRKQIA